MANKISPKEQISRIVDVVIAGLALVILSPLMALIAAAIIVETGRPVFFTQTRLGQGGKWFRIIKFRKFHSRDDDTGPLLTVRGDSRMSRIGSVLERTKLDELPQFLNVLKGDMAIVGPRPDTSVATDRLTAEYRALLDYKPGIFGPAQIAFRNAGTLYPERMDRHAFYREAILPVKAALDLAYYPHRTLRGDLAWIVRGVLVVIGLYPTLRKLPAAPPPHQTETLPVPTTARDHIRSEISRLTGARPGGLHPRTK